MFEEHIEYPVQYISEHSLRDGERVLVRPIRSTDDPMMLELFYCFSRETIYYRFFSHLTEMPPARLKRFTNLDYLHEFALVAIYFDGTHDRIVGVVRYVRDKMHRNRAEVAIVVQDGYQHKGIGTLLLRLLHRPASDNGIDTFVGYIMIDNEHIFRMIDAVGYRYHKITETGNVCLTVQADENPIWDVEPVPIGPCGPVRRPWGDAGEMPFSGKHTVVFNEFQEKPAQSRKKIIGATPGIRIGKGLFETIYQSPPIKLPFPANRAVVTWNADTPSGSSIYIRYRVRSLRRRWSTWFDMGRWGVKDIAPRNDTDRIYGKLHIDELHSPVHFSILQYEVILDAGLKGTSPTLRRICVSVSDDAIGDPVKVDHPREPRRVQLDVPWLSQFRPETVLDHKKREAGVCAPTSLTMALRYRGVDVDVDHIAELAFDPVAKIFGNWAFLVATAAMFGRPAHIERFNSWAAVRDYIDKGTPVIISIAYPKGTFTAEPDRCTAGHLLVVIGYTESGNIIANDPGTRYEDRGAAFVFPADELGVAFFGHGGVAIIVE